MPGEQGMTQRDAVASVAGLEALFVYGATACGRIQEFARICIVYDYVSVFVNFAHEAATPAPVAQIVPGGAVFQITGDDGPGRKRGSS